MRWKAVFQAFGITFGGRLSAGRRWTKATEFTVRSADPTPVVRPGPRRGTPRRLRDGGPRREWRTGPHRGQRGVPGHRPPRRGL